MFCTNCGNNLVPGAAFCTNCGSPVAGNITEQAGTPAAEAVPYTAPVIKTLAETYTAPVIETPAEPVIEQAAEATAEVFAAPVFEVPADVVPQSNECCTSEQGMNFDFDAGTAQAASAKKYEYKVLSQKDKWFTGKFDPAILEQALNAYASQGWKVIGCATADITGFGSTRQEFITIMEREI